MPNLVVSDSSPLINLYLIGRFTLLKDFFKSITIPGAVWKEITEGNKSGADLFREEREKGFLIVEPVSHSPLLQLLRWEIDEGEAEAIVLAITKKSDLLLIDEKEARSIARLYTLKLTGVLGILIRARREHKIVSLRQELDSLQGKGFRIREDLVKEALRSVHEEK